MVKSGAHHPLDTVPGDQLHAGHAEFIYLWCVIHISVWNPSEPPRPLGTYFQYLFLPVHVRPSHAPRLWTKRPCTDHSCFGPYHAKCLLVFL